MYIHFTYSDNSNPFICIRDWKLLDMIVKYSLIQIGEMSFHVEQENKPIKRTYSNMKEVVREFAIQWQYDFDRFNYSYGELAEYQDFFTKYGKKYGLLREFHENGIC